MNLVVSMDVSLLVPSITRIVSFCPTLAGLSGPLLRGLIRSQ